MRSQPLERQFPPLSQCSNVPPVMKIFVDFEKAFSSPWVMTNFSCVGGQGGVSQFSRGGTRKFTHKLMFKPVNTIFTEVP
jgi:hypothetical protein